jgi:hypothetical protein
MPPTGQHHQCGNSANVIKVMAIATFVMMGTATDGHGNNNGNNDSMVTARARAEVRAMVMVTATAAVTMNATEIAMAID